MSEIKTLIQGSATIVKVATFKEGDAYKRLVKQSYSDTYQQYFGVVTGIHHNGDVAMLTCLEFDPENASSGPSNKVFGEGSDLNIFPATPEEIAAALVGMQEALDREIRSAQNRVENLEEKQRQLTQVLGTTVTTPEVLIGDAVLEVTA
jgi:hypothetical protein